MERGDYHRKTAVGSSRRYFDERRNGSIPPWNNYDDHVAKLLSFPGSPEQLDLPITRV